MSKEELRRLEIQVDQLGAGDIVLGGKDISRMVRSGTLRFRAGEITRAELELVAVSIESSGPAEVTLKATELVEESKE